MWYKNVQAQNFLVILIAFVGLAGTAYIVHQKPELSADEQQQAEFVVFTHLIDYITSHPDENPDYFFISVMDSDPSSWLLNKLHNSDPQIEPVSSSRMTYGFSSSVIHKKYPDRFGMIISILHINKEPDGKVKVLSNLYQSRGSVATIEHTLSKNDGKYHVSSVTQIDK